MEFEPFGENVEKFFEKKIFGKKKILENFRKKKSEIFEKKVLEKRRVYS